MTDSKSISRTAETVGTPSTQEQTADVQSADVQRTEEFPTFSPALQKALAEVPTGKIPYKLTNDYMFRAVMQSKTEVLKRLLASLLGIQLKEIQSLEIRNPINLGDDIRGKDVILDIMLLLNNERIIDIEMQVANEHFWKERSLYYACRSFSNLNSGEEYDKVKGVVNIGILDFNLFEKEEVFYSRNILMDEKTHRIYSGKFGINVLCLTQIKKATMEDISMGLDHWANLFRAKTWEDLKKLTRRSEVLSDMVVKLAELTGTEKIRLQCEAREHYAKEKRTYESMIKESKAEKEKERVRADKEKDRADKEKDRADVAEAFAVTMKLELLELKDQLKQQQEMIQELQRRLTAQESQQA